MNYKKYEIILISVINPIILIIPRIHYFFLNKYLKFQLTKVEVKDLKLLKELQKEFIKNFSLNYIPSIGKYRNDFKHTIKEEKRINIFKNTKCLKIELIQNDSIKNIQAKFIRLIFLKVFDISLSKKESEKLAIFTDPAFPCLKFLYFLNLAENKYFTQINYRLMKYSYKTFIEVFEIKFSHKSTKVNYLFFKALKSFSLIFKNHLWQKYKRYIVTEKYETDFPSINFSAFKSIRQKLNLYELKMQYTHLNNFHLYFFMRTQLGQLCSYVIDNSNIDEKSISKIEDIYINKLNSNHNLKVFNYG